MIKINNDFLKRVEVTEFSYEGYGVVRIEGYPILVSNAYLHEIIDIKIIKYFSKYAFGKVAFRYSCSLKRNKNFVNDNLLIDNSKLIFLDYDEQLKFKQKIVNELFSRELNFNKVKNIVSSDNITGYRNKIILHVQFSKKTLLIGEFQENTHTIVEQENYILANNALNNLIKYTTKVLKDNLELLDETNIKSIIFRNSILNNEQQICFISESNNSKNIKKPLLDKIFLKFPNCKISQNIGNKKIVYSDRDWINFNFDNINYPLSPETFFQINESQALKIFKTIENKISNNKSKTNLIDAYSGLGVIGITLSKYVNNVLCVESNKKAVENGNELILKNSLNNVRFYNLDCTEFFEKNKEINIDTIVFDPPRDGLTPNIINVVISNKINNIIYLSCNPRTLVRDLKIFNVSNNYEIEYVQPFDMFPQTPHIETLVFLKLKSNFN